MALLFLAVRAPAYAYDEPTAKQEWWRTGIVEVLSKVRQMFLPFGQEIDPNGGRLTGGGVQPESHPRDFDLGHEIDPNG